MSISWKYVKKLKKTDAVQCYLDENHVNLPKDLLNIINLYNGGRPSEKTIVTDKEKEYVFKSLLSYNSDDKETIYGIYPDLFKGTSLYPIGSDTSGNFVCFDWKQKKYILLNHETEESETINKLPFIP